MSWGKAIIFVFIVFAAFIGTLVVQMVRQRVDLVRDDYYQDELAYQRQMVRVANARRWAGTPFVEVPPGQPLVRLTLPPGLRTGTLTLYRPADRRQDVRVPLAATDASVRSISLHGRPGGLWRAQLAWTDGRRDYYTEQKLLLP